MAGGKERRFVELLKGLKSFSSIDFEIVLMNEDVHYTDVLLLDKNIHSVIRKSKRILHFKFIKFVKAFNQKLFIVLIA